MTHRMLFGSSVLALGALTSLASAQDAAVVLEGARVVVAPRSVLDGPAARIAIRGGKVASVGAQIPADLSSRAERTTFEGATLVPGFVLAHTQLDLARDLAETISAITPSLRAADAFDPFDERLATLARGGVPTVGLAPSSSNVVGGLGAAVRWHADGIGEVFEPTSYLKTALVADALAQDRAPTSRMGAADAMRGQFALARDPLRRAEPTFAEVLQGSRQIAVHADTAAEISETLALCAEFEITQPILIGAREADRCLTEIARSGASLALSPLTFESKPARLALPAALAKAGVPFSFLGRDADAMRRSAALAVRHGLAPEAAMAALTRIPAMQIGVEDRVGTLRNGRLADVAVFDGDPLDLTSKLLAVYVGGQRLPTEKETDR